MTATNAYQLLDEVVVAIVAEPKRINMKFWVMSALNLGKRAKANVPACGTVACCAGWICGLARPAIVVNAAIKGDQETHAGSVVLTAKQLLGADRFDWRYKEAVGELFNGAGSDIDRHRPGSKAYALAVAGRIRAFQSAWRENLMNTPVSAE